MNYVIPMTHILGERFNDQQRLLQAYIDGNLLRYFMLNTYPWAVGLLLLSSWTQYVPEFFAEFKKIEFCKALMVITKEATFDEFKKNIWEQATKELGGWSFHNDNLIPVFNHAGISSQNEIASEL